jgi:hypothetical protein
MLPDTERELRWYYENAEGACGERSWLGPMLDVLRSGTLPGRRVSISDDSLSMRQLEAAEQANEIGARLKQLTKRQRCVLELQYDGSAMLTPAISLSLATTTTAAFVWYMRKQQRLKAKGELPLESIRGGLIVMAARSRKDAGMATLLAAVVAEANRELDGAQRAYEAAVRPKRRKFDRR